MDKNQIKDFILSELKRTGNKSGIGLAKLVNVSGLEYSQLREMLNEIHKEGTKIRKRKGMNDELIFLE